jgi:sortase A
MRLISWLLITAGLLLTGYGFYYYYSSQQGQRQAGQEWAAEEPVPARPPALPEKQYFNPYKLGDPVAKLRVPRLAATLFVVEGTDQKDLKKGPGHMPGTALPGVTGNCVIAGHRDTHFRVLEQIRKGDEVELDTHYGTFRYKVRSMEVVLPTNVSSLRPTSDAVLHLITCYPFNYIGHAPKRMVIEADLDSHPLVSRLQAGVERGREP